MSRNTNAVFKQYRHTKNAKISIIMQNNDVAYRRTSSSLYKLSLYISVWMCTCELRIYPTPSDSSTGGPSGRHSPENNSHPHPQDSFSSVFDIVLLSH